MVIYYTIIDNWSTTYYAVKSWLRMELFLGLSLEKCKDPFYKEQLL